ncbi:MAG: hypothetical protein ACFFE4_00425 [Candidatus Thorarchaeota archaeon]
MKKIIFIILFLFLNGCVSIPKKYITKVYEKDNILYVEQQGRGNISAKKESGEWKEIKTDYKSVSLFEDITKLYAIKKIEERK